MSWTTTRQIFSKAKLILMGLWLWISMAPVEAKSLTCTQAARNLSPNSLVIKISELEQIEAYNQQVTMEYQNFMARLSEQFSQSQDPIVRKQIQEQKRQRVLLHLKHSQNFEEAKARVIGEILDESQSLAPQQRAALMDDFLKKSKFADAFRSSLAEAHN